MPIIGYEKAQWVKDLSMGVCGEEVTEKTGPKSAGSIKTFKPISSLEKILKQMHLVSIDLVLKIKEHLKDFEVFPLSLLVYQKKAISYSGFKTDGADSFKKTFKMVSYEDFKEDPNCLVEHIKNFCKANEGLLPFPARMCGATVTNFKPLSVVKLPTRKIDNIFARPQDSDEKNKLAVLKEAEKEKLNQEIKVSKQLEAVRKQAELDQIEALKTSSKRTAATTDLSKKRVMKTPSKTRKVKGASKGASKGDKRQSAAAMQAPTSAANQKLTAFFKPKDPS